SVLARAYPRVIGAAREPSWLFFDLVFPILGMCSIVFLLRSRGVDEAWIASTILATALLSFWISVVWMMGAQFHWERDSGNLLLYITAPVGLGAIALGMAIGGALGVVIRAVIITVAGVLLFGAKYQVADPFLLALVILAGVAAMYSLGVCLSSVFLISGREADHLGSLLNEPMQLLGGVYAPVRSMGTAGVVALGILPLAPAIDALRQVAVPQLAATGILPVGVELLILLVMTIVFGVIGRVLLAHIERVGRAGGKLLARAD
ncbi:MAG: ABC transporter permease, partial [Chloroflexi bacterium]|nr:ABC transporter permease [Chloroflexota bacterium]